MSPGGWQQPSKRRWVLHLWGPSILAHVLFAGRQGAIASVKPPWDSATALMPSKQIAAIGQAPDHHRFQFARRARLLRAGSLRIIIQEAYQAWTHRKETCHSGRSAAGNGALQTGSRSLAKMIPLARRCARAGGRTDKCWGRITHLFFCRQAGACKRHIVGFQPRPQLGPGPRRAPARVGGAFGDTDHASRVQQLKRGWP